MPTIGQSARPRGWRAVVLIPSSATRSKWNTTSMWEKSPSPAKCLGPELRAVRFDARFHRIPRIIGRLRPSAPHPADRPHHNFRAHAAFPGSKQEQKGIVA
jgi:hypothetical protein